MARASAGGAAPVSDKYHKYLFLMTKIFHVLALWCALLSSPSHAQWPYDVPFVPSPQVVVDEMLRLAEVTKDDFVMDLGSGDGRILITAAQKFGARGIGVDLDASLIEQSLANAQTAGVSERVQFLRQDLFKTDLSQASVITLYLLPGVNMRLRPALLALKPGTRIVAHDFELGDWKPDVKVTLRKNAMLWIVPANVAGRWQLRVNFPEGERVFDVEIRQQYQEIDGVVRIADAIPGGLWQTSLRGDKVRFAIVDNVVRELEATMYFEGVARDGVMAGELRRGVGAAQTRHPWRAIRIPK